MAGVHVIEVDKESFRNWLGRLGKPYTKLSLLICDLERSVLCD